MITKTSNAFMRVGGSPIRELVKFVQGAQAITCFVSRLSTYNVKVAWIGNKIL